jgi:hypothetical protein
MIRIIRLKKNAKSDSIDTLLNLYQIYDDNRNARLWFLDVLDVANYDEYTQKYSCASFERSHFSNMWFF